MDATLESPRTRLAELDEERSPPARRNRPGLSRGRREVPAYSFECITPA